jgi:hypothetical protein
MVEKNFQMIRDDPEWQSLSFQQKHQVRQQWVNKMMGGSVKPDPARRKMLEEEAFEDAPWSKTPEPGFFERNPRLRGVAATAIGVPLKILGTPGQLTSNLLDPITSGKKRPLTLRGALESIKEPFERTGRWMTGGWETEATQPFGASKDPLVQTAIALGETAIDPLAYMGVPSYLKESKRIAGFGEKVGKVIPRLTEKSIQAERAAQVAKAGGVGAEIPRSFTTFSPQQRGAYQQVMAAGRRWFDRDELRDVAETIANLPEKQASSALKKLQAVEKGNDARSILAWARKSAWERPSRWWKPGAADAEGAFKEAAKKVGVSDEAIAEATSKIGDWSNYITEMMKEPTLGGK